MSTLFLPIEKICPTMIELCYNEVSLRLIEHFPPLADLRRYFESSWFSTFPQKNRKRKQFADDKYAQRLASALN